MGHLRTEIMSNSCDPPCVEHGGDEETADVARQKGTAPRRDGLRRGVRRDFGRWGQPAAPRPASPMAEFLKTMAKYGFRLQRGTGDHGGNTPSTHSVSTSSSHKSICIGNGMTAASTQDGALEFAYADSPLHDRYKSFRFTHGKKLGLHRLHKAIE
jgi:hypothetical protein